ncbi:MAG TPA: zinc-ribbon domain-containing protein, partial [Pyrinomonadaceae bacterium]|nr:zinc-ribbon domain-containing protein [Pyrinomonadaceae bacterium]
MLRLLRREFTNSFSVTSANAMIVVCSQCTTRLQLDDAKIPSRPFTVRCPKCQSIIHGQPPTTSNGQQSALSVGDAPALENTRFNPSMAAPVFKPDESANDNDVQAYSNAPSEPNELA